jgi:DNA polymerase-3 subunit alpha
VKNKQFVHLHLHTGYSLLDGACRIGQVIDHALANDMPAVAITDHGVLYGVIDFYKTAMSKGVKPIVGCEAYVAPGSRFERKSDVSRSHNSHLVLLATNSTGYANLMTLISAAHLEGFYYKPRIDREILASHHDGLIGMSACLKGEPANRLFNDDLAGAVKATGEYLDIFGKNNFFLEVQNHGLPEQTKVNQHMLELSRQSGAPIVATNDVHYLKKEHAAAHEVLLCLQTQTVMSDRNRMRYRTNEFYMKTRAEMEQALAEFPGVIDRTLEIAERCNLEIEFGSPHFPTFVTPKGITQKDYLIKLGFEGITSRYGIKDPVNPKDSIEHDIVARFHHEMTVIEKTGFINYFLVVWDFVRFAHEKQIPVGPGRGSGGGSLVAYVLGITAIDPLRYDLIFERFLNPERVSPPDFDIDFCQTRRGEVIEYVKNKYGKENVAQIITFGSLGSKTVIRDVGRALEIPYSKCDYLSKMIPEDPKMTLKLALEQNPEFKKAHDTDEDCKKILNIGFALEGLQRNAGTHAAGVVIGEKPLSQIIPLARDKEGQIITQFSMEPLGEIGLLKMDFLGLKTLTVIQEALDLIREHRGVTIELEKMPLDDKPTYELFNRGDTVGVFQLESAGMRDLIRRISVNRIEDLIAMIALYRPGPMNMLQDYVDRKCGKAKVTYEHPLLEPILKETYGVMVYQEQVQKAANVLAGYSLGQADILRRAMGKKKSEIMEKERARFVDGCKKTNAISTKLAGQIFDVMAKFAGYGFNKAHSAGYAVIAYQTAYLKANYPAEFMSALLSCEMGNADKLPVFISEAEEIGLKILPPDINTSGVRFTPAGDAIRFGLAGIKNIGEGAADAIARERRKEGPYTTLINFCSRLDGQTVNKKVVESLVRCGAMDSLKMHRARLFNAIDWAMSRAASMAKDRASGQGNLFGLDPATQSDANVDAIPDCSPWHESVLLAAEKELVGMYMSGHPLTEHAHILERYRLATVKTISQLEDKSLTRIGGIVSLISRKISKTTKEAWAIVQLEDLDGTMEILAFSDTYQKYGSYIVQDAAILVCGEVSKKEEPPKLIAYEIYPLADAAKHFSERVGIHVPCAKANDHTLEKIKDILVAHPGNTPVVICLQLPGGEKVFIDTDVSLKVLPDDELLQAIERELGENSVHVVANRNPCKKEKPTRGNWGDRQKKSVQN